MTRRTQFAQLVRQLTSFVAVGVTAALTHWSVTVLLVTWLDWTPPLANVAGWLIAFVVSFAGHHFLTFRSCGARWNVAARRLFLISSGNFVLNEIAYVALLRGTDLPYDGLLAGILIVQAVLTFLASRYWAFRSGPRREAP
ncbi:polysaccharide synthesis protein GtrA [Hylemonella gracilis str. Niagara R]|uniref:Polysaccharide synthesis protein GtrA n=1 Tax=Hylemonella gracilis str. Niagara R TaxID=1458275 RepID=A0A016XFN7_9BURK|nr:GtrA family protein [Hylemonella gracilis]EYC50725.1 polysaccharide synthesis protein GtrA [Hylemonella gracilis str. Niagara R]